VSNRRRQRRIALKGFVAYAVACLPMMFISTISGPHGPVMSLPLGIFMGLILPWESAFRIASGNYGSLPFFVMFLILLAIGVVVVWLTERNKREETESSEGTSQ
jgi:uncharacterized paraquat-inducible protein A